MNIKDYLLQDQKPSNSWLFKDTNQKVIRATCQAVNNPEQLTSDEELVVKKLIDFVVLSQDQINNHPDSSDYLRPAVGLAAPQIGVNKDIFYVRFNTNDEQIKHFAMINTKLISKSTQIVALSDGEGCLSVDTDHDGIVPRAYKIVVEGYDWITKQYLTLTLRGYQAIVFQHEMEHNLGKLYYDHINKKDPMFIQKDWILI
ncbi:peptide deformylase [Mycoplasma putrefaciens]|uniref:Peptide deformylase n=1 Tax=Mycoplasma putrefaciens Mput9231 TaxID=1292033 RepID=M9WAC9_9MOLU|nr:peptide deformylase [Mycoplasma putrefaciens]AGJ90938.1 Peptide deformylase 2 [Mycoplasma putrefaciens Mput9231]